MRLKQLDVLRAIAVLLVLGAHSDYQGGIVRVWQRIGWAGVDLFFVLSGFLVSGLLFNEYQKLGHVRIGRFLLRRGFKIYPSFYVMIAAVVVYVRPSNIDLKRLMVECLFIQNYHRGLQPYVIHTWSLAVEEHFYIILSVLIWLLVRNAKINWIPWIFAVTALLALSFRTQVVLVQGTNQWAAMLPSHTRMDSLFFGVLLSYMYWFQRDKFEKLSSLPWLPLVSVACLLPWMLGNVSNSGFLLTGGFTLNYIGFGTLMLWMLKLRAAAWMTPLAAIGKYSYSIYLWHVLVRLWLKPLFSDPGHSVWFFITYIVGSLLCGVVVARMIEFPVLAFRDRITRDTPKAAPLDVAKVAVPS